jgi:hypothetical protein
MVEGQMVLLLRSEMGHNRPSKKSGASGVCSEGLDKEQGDYEMWIFQSGREECFIKVVLKNNVYGSCSKKLYRIDVLTYFYKISRAWRINLISV